MLVAHSLQVAILSAGQYFGEEDLIDNQPRTLTAICTSTGAKLYTLRYAVAINVLR